jgi:hypothetical protein
MIDEYDDIAASYDHKGKDPRVALTRNESRGSKLLLQLFTGGVVMASTDGSMGMAFVTNGIVGLTPFDSFADLLSLVVSNLQGSSSKQGASDVKAAGVDLTATVTTNMFGCVVTVSFPRANVGVTEVSGTVAFTINAVAVTSTVRIFPQVHRGDFISAYQFVILATTDDKGRGTPAVATAVTVTFADGQAGLTDGETTLAVESLNMRDLTAL